MNYYLKRDGYWVRAVDIKKHEFCPSAADEFLLLDLGRPQDCEAALTISGAKLDEVYQLAADMGGMGFIHSAECEIMHNSALVNIHMTRKAAEMGIPRYFFSSSVCVYRDMEVGEPELSEEGAIPAHPDNEYGWEKLYSERVAMAYERRFGMQVRIARFQNCYGAEAHGAVDGRRHLLQSAERWRKSMTAARSRSGAMEAQFDPTHMSTIWWKASSC